MRFSSLVISAIVLHAVSASAWGQRPPRGQDPGDVRHRDDCRHAAQILTDGGPAVERPWALDIIRTCAGADSVIPAVWSDPTEGEDELMLLFHASRDVRDGRIYEAADDVASDPSRPVPLRLVALGVLGSYLKPNLAMRLDHLRRLEGWPDVEWRSIWGTMDHDEQIDGAVPLPADAEAQISELIRSLADSDPARQVRDQATWLIELYGVGGANDSGR